MDQPATRHTRSLSSKENNSLSINTHAIDSSHSSASSSPHDAAMVGKSELGAACMVYTEQTPTHRRRKSKTSPELNASSDAPPAGDEAKEHGDDQGFLRGVAEACGVFCLLACARYVVAPFLSRRGVLMLPREVVRRLGKLVPLFGFFNTTWIYRMVMLCIYAGVLLYGLMRETFDYFSDSKIHREICYGKEGRNHLDIFLPRPLGARAKDVLCVPDGQKPKQTNGRTLGRQPKQGSLQSLLIKGAAGAANGDGDKDLTSLRYLDTTVPIQHVEPLASKRSDTATGNGDARLAPVVIMVSGGAWLIGYKGWGGFVARKLAELGIMVVSVDYRNFPEAQVSDMVSDVEHAVEWVCRNIEKYGGDPANVTLCGHSAGAHLGACVMLRRAMKQRQLPHGSAGEDEISGHKLASFVGLSGAYNLRGIMEHCHEMGLYRHVFLELFEGEENLDEYSPALFVEQQTNMQGIVLPPIHLMHGSADKTIPYKSTVSFAEILRDKGYLVSLHVMEGKSHTDCVIEDHLSGGRDPVIERIASVALKRLVHMEWPRTVPELVVQIGRRLNPF